jgi:hypothetical protein
LPKRIPQALWPDRDKKDRQGSPFPPIRPGFSAMSRIASGSWDAHKRNIRGLIGGSRRENLISRRPVPILANAASSRPAAREWSLIDVLSSPLAIALSLTRGLQIATLASTSKPTHREAM